MPFQHFHLCLNSQIVIISIHHTNLCIWKNYWHLEHRQETQKSNNPKDPISRSCPQCSSKWSAHSFWVAEYTRKFSRLKTGWYQSLNNIKQRKTTMQQPNTKPAPLNRTFLGGAHLDAWNSIPHTFQFHVDLICSLRHEVAGVCCVPDNCTSRRSLRMLWLLAMERVLWNTRLL